MLCVRRGTGGPELRQPFPVMVSHTADGDAMDRRCFSTWLEPVFSQCSYESLWSAAQEIHLISSESTRSSASSTDLQSDCDGPSEIDPWEISFGLNWLTRLLAFTIRQTAAATDGDHDWESLSSLVGQVMAQMTGSPDCPAHSFLRRYQFDISFQGQGREGLDAQKAAMNRQVEIEIREGSLSFSAIGSQTWNSAPLLCRRLCCETFHFFPQLQGSMVKLCPANPAPPSPEISCRRRSLKVLELGSGTGLVGLTASQVLAFVLSSTLNSGPIDVQVFLTDYHPDVLENLQHNLDLNKSRHTLPDDCPSTLSVKVAKLDWREPESSEIASDGLEGAFDVILGSDLVYEPEHAVWASNAVRYFLKLETEKIDSRDPISDTKTTARTSSWLDPQPSFHLLLPLRPTFTRESEAVHQVFGGSDMKLLLDQTDQVAGSLPIHSCKWEWVANCTRAKEFTQTLTTRPFKITHYSKEEGVQFGQGCGEYQYLQIRWDDRVDSHSQ
ncbi:hypothetical protein PCASD_08790 [Puccinia coronata f. sp. avenae]|uniref:Uncharacterized protein n=1 Tax=Puccinia coronata f. sp. avenae TaxID=200324 RepID=A0A2N5RV25_9BASI|nr:hypothetical protein PCASD_26543 [Puccinia coronata f. sp. avenae]PLW39614.1 hypothetical protein PCASD_08790 [Puccinia coronata f. sp. avenae]